MRRSVDIAQSSISRKVALLLLSLVLAASTVCVPFSSNIPQAQADELVVALDPGHGGNDPGAVGINGVKEANANWAITQACMKELQTYAGVKVVLAQDNTVCLSRKERTDAAIKQGADLIVSMHCNSASSSGAYGSEVYIPNSSAFKYNETHVPGKKLANLVLRNLNNLGFYNRGAKEWSYNAETYPSPGGVIDYLGMNYYPRLYGVCGILIEHAFVSNPSDAAKLASASWCEKIGKADAQAIAEFYGLRKASEVVANPNLQKTGEAVTTKSVYQDNSFIMGDPKVDVARMVEWYKSKNKTFPAATYEKYGAKTIEEYCTILYDEATYEGVRPEVVFAQAMKETGWLAFGGQVKAEQCNFCGLGALDGGAAGADFSSYGKDAVRMGLRAQVQHLKAYACTDALKRTGAGACVDPRFDKVTRGSSPTVMGLTGKWATAPDYGERLVAMIAELAKTTEVVEGATNVKISLADVPAELLSGSATTVYVDGVAATMNVSGGNGTVSIEGTEPHSIVLYEYNKAGASDPHTVYPTGMHAWVVTCENGSYVAKRYYGFDDLLRYAGSSIRITGNKGIRMITGITEQAKGALTGSGIAGYTVVETGTLLAWSDRVQNESLTFDTQGVSRGKAYVKGKTNPVFSKSGGIEYYTNVLVGFNTADQYKRDMAMRPYIILADKSGNQVVLYGGTLHRSIGYIAQQNANAFSKGTAAYNYVHGIINACKG